MGADYEIRHITSFRFTSELVHAAGLTRYIGTGGGISNAPAVVEGVIETHGISLRLRAFQNTPPGGVETNTYTLVVNGVPTAQTVTLTGAQQTGVDAVNTVPLVPGDRICVEVISSGAAAAGTPKACIAVKEY